jgi:hypothetical protein
MTTPQPVRQPKQDVKVTEEKKVISFDFWLQQLYNIALYSDEEVLAMNEAFKYVGFDRKLVLKQLYDIAPESHVAAQIVVACALRGPIQAAKLKLSNGKTIESMGIPASGMKGSSKISCARVTAATADLAAYFLKRIDSPKRLFNFECPGWLQFPSAGSIRLPENLRQQHLLFSQEFSKVIGGVFNGQIYGQMTTNAYYDETLKLF